MLRAPGRHVQSVADSSFDAWIKFYRPDENSPNACVSYYAKGALVALRARPHARRDGSTTLDDLMRALWQRYGQPGIGVPEDAHPAPASELAGRDLGDFFARYVDGTEDPPLAELLADSASTLHARRPPAQAIAAASPRAAQRRAARSACKVGDRSATQHVFAADRQSARACRGPTCSSRSTACKRIAGADRLYARAAAARREGPVHAFRRDELDAFAVMLAAAPLDTAWLALDDGAAPRRSRGAPRGCANRERYSLTSGLSV